MHQHTYKRVAVSDVECVEQVERPAPTPVDGCTDVVGAPAVLRILYIMYKH